MNPITCVIFLLLILLVYQDYRYRAVSWLVFPLLIIAFSANSLYHFGLSTFIENTLTNLAFIFFQLLLLTLYFSIKRKKITNITSAYLGIGDILFLVCLCFFFSSIHYITFYIFSLLFVLVFIGLVKILRYYQLETIPLAGLQANLLLVYGLCGGVSLHRDDWLLTLLF